MPHAIESRAAPDWLQPPAEQVGLRAYLQMLRERIWLVLAVVALTLAGAGAYLLTADEVYRASTDVLVAPASSDDSLLVSLGVLVRTNDPTRDNETAARLASNLEVAERAREELGTERSARSLSNRVTVTPVATSNLIAIEAEGASPQQAADLANAWADAFIAVRTDSLHEEIDKALPNLRGSLQAQREGVAPAVGPDETLQSEIARLELLRTDDDPTLEVVAPALPPTAAASPKPRLTIAAGLLAGLVLGVAAAFGARVLDPRLRREEQLRTRYRLPILARVPREGSRRRGLPLVPGTLSGPAQEAFRTLRANVTAAGQGSHGSRAVLITGSAPGEGKTTTAINLATSFALSGKSVILIEADLRRPAIGKALGVGTGKGIVGTLLEEVALEEALVTAPSLGPNLRMLLADYEGGWVSELFWLRAAQQLVDEAKELADIVVVDSPPLAAVVDTLPLAGQVDSVVIVTRLGLTRLDNLQELAELLAANEIEPFGFAVLGAPSPEASEYYRFGTELRARTKSRDGPAPSTDREPRARERARPAEGEPRARERARPAKGRSPRS